MITDQELFSNPRGKAARRLAQLRARRRELQRQQREALLERDAAEREHNQLTDRIDQAESHALAHDKPADTKTDKAKLIKTAKRVDELTAHADALDRAVITLAGEMAELAREHYDELLAEALDNHAAAADRIAVLIGQLHAELDTAKQAYTAAQALAANAGHHAATARLRATPSAERAVRDGGIPALVHDDDRALAA